MSILKELGQRYPEKAAELITVRPILKLLSADDDAVLSAALEVEESQERENDRAYWLPLKAELEALRHQKRQSN